MDGMHGMLIACEQSCAYLRVKKAYQSMVKPNIISINHNAGFAAQFQWQGTRDVTPWLCVPRAIEFYHAQGGFDCIAHRNNRLIIEAAKYLSKLFGTKPLVPSTMLACMVTIPLPDSFQHNITEQHARAIYNRIYSRFRIEGFFCVAFGKLCCRVCANIYNYLHEYHVFGQAVMELAESETSANHS